jgi:hypothetical protein
MRSLWQNLTTVRTKVMGTYESHIKIWSLIWGMCLKKSPPSIWLTVNPANTQDPIAQVFIKDRKFTMTISMHWINNLQPVQLQQTLMLLLHFSPHCECYFESLLGIRG